MNRRDRRRRRRHRLKYNFILITFTWTVGTALFEDKSPFPDLWNSSFPAFTTTGQTVAEVSTFPDYLATVLATSTPLPTSTSPPTITPTPTATATATPTPTATPSPTATATPSPTPTPTITPSPTATATATATPSPTPDSGLRGYILDGKWITGEGDTLKDIARHLDMTLRDLIALNPQIRNPDLIYPEQPLNLPE